jgi:hypothetical protein
MNHLPIPTTPNYMDILRHFRPRQLIFDRN